MNAPYLISTALPAGSAPRTIAKSEKFTPPMTLPSTGMMTSPTSEDTILPNAAPMITPTARSTTLPFIANSLNSDAKPTGLSFFRNFDATDDVTERPWQGQVAFGHLYAGRGSLELRVQPHCNHRYRPAITVIGGMIDPLIVQTKIGEFQHCGGIVGFDDLFRAGVRQAAIADENAQAAGVQISFARAGYAIVDGGQSNGIVAPMPARALQRKPRGQGTVNVRKLVGLDIAAGLAGANERAQIRGDLLLKTQAPAEAASVSSNRG